MMKYFFSLTSYLKVSAAHSALRDYNSAQQHTTAAVLL